MDKGLAHTKKTASYTQRASIRVAPGHKWSITGTTFVTRTNGLILFILYIAHPESIMNITPSKFTDETKVAGKALRTANRDIIQRNLDRIIQWPEKWQMFFNIKKCNVIYIRPRNTNHICCTTGEPLELAKE